MYSTIDETLTYTKNSFKMISCSPLKNSLRVSPVTLVPQTLEFSQLRRSCSERILFVVWKVIGTAAQKMVTMIPKYFLRVVWSIFSIEKVQKTSTVNENENLSYKKDPNVCWKFHFLKNWDGTVAEITNQTGRNFCENMGWQSSFQWFILCNISLSTAKRREDVNATAFDSSFSVFTVLCSFTETCPPKNALTWKPPSVNFFHFSD